MNAIPGHHGACGGTTASRLPQQVNIQVSFGQGGGANASPLYLGQPGATAQPGPAQGGLAGLQNLLQSVLQQLQNNAMQFRQHGLESRIGKLESRKTELNTQINQLNKAQAHLKDIGATKHKAQWAQNVEQLKQARTEIEQIDKQLADLNGQLGCMKAPQNGCASNTATPAAQAQDPSAGNTPWNSVMDFFSSIMAGMMRFIGGSR